MLNVHAKNLDTVTVLCLQGQIVNGETEVLRRAVHSVSESTVVILDLARVTTVDARGLGVMLELRQQLADRGIRLKLINLNSPISRVMEITHLDSVFQISSGVEFFPAARLEVRHPVGALKSCA